jgi:hypothetical protein
VLVLVLVLVGIVAVEFLGCLLGFGLVSFKGCGLVLARMALLLLLLPDLTFAALFVEDEEEAVAADFLLCK